MNAASLALTLVVIGRRRRWWYGRTIALLAALATGLLKVGPRVPIIGPLRARRS